MNQVILPIDLAVKLPKNDIAFSVNEVVESIPRAFDTYESKKHQESPRGLIFFVKSIGYNLRDFP